MLLKRALVVVLLMAAAAPAAGQAPASSAPDVAGEWQMATDDETTRVAIELTVSADRVTGAMIEIERGYFSGRETVTGQYAIRGTRRGDAVEATLEDGSGQSIAATLIRRGEYLVLRVGNSEQGFARPGRSLVQSADGSPAAAALSRTVAGRVYGSSSQAAGGGAFAGGRVRIAFCADRRIEFDASDLAGTPGSLPGQGVDFGSSTARRGRWSVVMLAGAPAIMAEWQGTGTSYALTRYFVARPVANSTALEVDGAALPLIGSC